MPEMWSGFAADDALPELRQRCQRMILQSLSLSLSFFLSFFFSRSLILRGIAFPCVVTTSTIGLRRDHSFEKEEEGVL
jgi:hypothetical protein